MKKLYNTLYIQRQRTYVHKERATIVVKEQGEKIAQFPAVNLSNIVCFGNVTVTPFLMGFCADNGIGLSFYTEYGKFLARVQGKTTGNVLLRRKQYRIADDEQDAVSIARVIVAAKIENSRSVLMRELRNHGKNVTLDDAAKRLAASGRRLKEVEALDSIRGVEGEAAATYFGVFNELVRNEGFAFGGRVRRPPTDPVNALLSFAYSLITQECVSALSGVGLDPFVGFLHRDRPGRSGLALDMLEEFRAAWADRFVLTLLNRKQMNPRDFVCEASGAVRLSDDSRKQFLVAWQERKQAEITHPYLKEQVPVGLLPHCQAMLLSRHLRGDTEFYPPYVLK